MTKCWALITLGALTLLTAGCSVSSDATDTDEQAPETEITTTTENPEAVIRQHASAVSRFRSGLNSTMTSDIMDTWIALDRALDDLPPPPPEITPLVDDLRYAIMHMAPWVRDYRECQRATPPQDCEDEARMVRAGSVMHAPDFAPWEPYL